jgi:hypothetical protein
MNRRVEAWWFSSLGAAAVACCGIVFSHIWLDAGRWLTTQPQGWNIYPPLGTVLQAVPASTGDPFLYMLYTGVLLTASIAALLGVGCWLVAWGLNFRIPAGARPVGWKVFWLPVGLLLPVGVHVAIWLSQL